MNRTLALAALMLLPMEPQQKTFKADVELVAVEATVIDNKNAPVQGLGPSDFDVTISGHSRHVVKAEWLTYGTERATQSTADPPIAAVPSAGAAPSAAPPQRKYVIAIDEESFQPAAVMAAKAAAERFIDKLRSDDYVGVYAYPTGKANMALSQDHAAVKKVLAAVNAVRHEPISQYHLTVGEIVDIANGDNKAFGVAVHRECGGDPGDDSPVSMVNPRGCPQQILTEANGLAGSLEMDVTRSVEGLRGLIRGLARVPGRKILVLVSGELYSSDRVVGRRVSSGSTIHTLTHDAAAADLELYVLHLDWSFLESFAEQNLPATSYYRNSDVAEAGLDILASDLGGDVTRVRGTNPDFAFNQVLTKTSSYYLLGVEPADEDRDGKAHPIKVKVKRRGVEVLSRTEVTIPPK
jgi:VWFA-related protein